MQEVEVKMRVSYGSLPEKVDLPVIVLYRPMKRWVRITQDFKFKFKAQFPDGTEMSLPKWSRDSKENFLKIHLSCGVNPFTRKEEKFFLPIDLGTSDLNELNKYTLEWKKHQTYVITEETQSISLVSCLKQ